VFITIYLSIISKDFLVKHTNIKYLFLLLYSFKSIKVPRSITSKDFVFNLKQSDLGCLKD